MRYYSNYEIPTLHMIFTVTETNKWIWFGYGNSGATLGRNKLRCDSVTTDDLIYFVLHDICLFHYIFTTTLHYGYIYKWTTEQLWRITIFHNYFILHTYLCRTPHISWISIYKAPNTHMHIFIHGILYYRIRNVECTDKNTERIGLILNYYADISNSGNIEISYVWI